MLEHKAGVILPLIYWMESGGMWGLLYERLSHEGVLIFQTAQLAAEIYQDSLKEFE